MARSDRSRTTTAQQLDALQGASFGMGTIVGVSAAVLERSRAHGDKRYLSPELVREVLAPHVRPVRAQGTGTMPAMDPPIDLPDDDDELLVELKRGRNLIVGLLAAGVAAIGGVAILASAL